MAKRDGLRMKLRNELKLEGAEPDWQDRVLESVFSRPLPKVSSNRKGRQAGNHLTLTVGQNFKDLVKLAAEQRGVSTVTYMRRSVAAFIAHDLNITIGDVLGDGPRPQAWGKSGVSRHDAPEETGEGYGPWKIGELHE